MINRDYIVNGVLLTDKLPAGVNENGPVWCAIYLFLQELARKKGISLEFEMPKDAIHHYHDFSKNKWYPFYDHTKLIEEGFSRDNFVAVTSWLDYCQENNMSYVPIAWFDDAFNIRQHFQPQDIALYGIVADKWWCNDYIASIILTSRFDHIVNNLSQHKGLELDTDGPVLTFLRCHAGLGDKEKLFESLSDDYAISLAKYMHSGNPSIREQNISSIVDPFGKPWTWTFYQYFGDIQHPIVDLANKLEI